MCVCVLLQVEKHEPNFTRPGKKRDKRAPISPIVSPFPSLFPTLSPALVFDPSLPIRFSPLVVFGWLRFCAFSCREMAICWFRVVVVPACCCCDTVTELYKLCMLYSVSLTRGSSCAKCAYLMEYSVLCVCGGVRAGFNGITQWRQMSRVSLLRLFPKQAWQKTAHRNGMEDKKETNTGDRKSVV